MIRHILLFILGMLTYKLCEEAYRMEAWRVMASECRKSNTLEVCLEKEHRLPLLRFTDYQIDWMTCSTPLTDYICHNYVKGRRG
jgi:hypothetical protein